MEKYNSLSDRIKYVNSFVFGAAIFLWYRASIWLSEVFMEIFELGTFPWRAGIFLPWIIVPLIIVCTNAVLIAVGLPKISLFFKDGSLEKQSRNGCITGYIIGGLVISLLFRYLERIFG